jgi:hypothetical protein
MAAERTHIFDEAAQLGEFLRDFGLGNEGAFTAANFDQAALDQVLHRLLKGGAAHAEALEQAFLVRQAAAWRIGAVRDAGCQHRFNLGVERNAAFGIDVHVRHSDIMTS